MTPSCRLLLASLFDLDKSDLSWRSTLWGRASDWGSFSLTSIATGELEARQSDLLLLNDTSSTANQDTEDVPYSRIGDHTALLH